MTAMPRGRRLLIAWALFAQIVLMVLVGWSLASLHAEINAHTDELKKIKHNTAVTAHTAKEVRSLDVLIITALAGSKHPGEVDQSVLFQLCHLTAGCRIP